MKSFFFKNFLKNWKQVGSVTPSSKFLTAKMLKPVDFTKAKTIVELGPGTGVFTKEILGKMSKEAKLTVFETNHDFVERLKKIKDNRFTILEISAENVSVILGDEKADVIVSGIPFSAIKRDIREKMLYEIKDNLKKGGVFIQFQYSLDLYKLLNKIFDNNVDITFVPINVPPAFVYTCKVK